MKHDFLNMCAMVTCLLFVQPVWSKDSDPDMRSAYIHFGTLERTETGYTYKDKDGSRIFEDSILSSKSPGNRPDGLPDLRRVGFRASDGNVYHWKDDEQVIDYLNRFKKEHPDLVSVSTVFEGITGTTLELGNAGVTRVCFVEVELKVGRVVVLWSNLPRVEPEK